MTITIYHNPNCETSNNVLAYIRATGEEPIIIEYLKTPPTKEELVKLIKDGNSTIREAIRSKENLYKTLGMDDSSLTDDQLLDLMLANPILINRPIVITDKGTKLCRPSQEVLKLL